MFNKIIRTKEERKLCGLKNKEKTVCVEETTIMEPNTKNTEDKQKKIYN